MNTTPPKVFVSHAHNDQARFVTAFASRLRADGIDAWYDKWEINSGDSIVQKVFDEGLEQSKCFIVVLSSVSVTKAWVNTELSAAVIKQIDESAKIIPVVIDHLAHEDIPLPLRLIRYERIADLANYDIAYQAILQSIFGVSAKPAIGVAPAYLTNQYPSIHGLNNTDSLVLKLLGEQAIQHDDFPWTNIHNLVQTARPMGLQQAALVDSLSILADHYLVDDNHNLVHLTDHGFETYLQAYYDGYGAVARRVGLEIDHGTTASQDVSAITGDPPIVVAHVFTLMEQRSMLKTRGVLDGTSNVSAYNVRPALKRWLDEGDSL